MPKKTLPAAPLNPSNLLDLFEQQTRTLGKLAVVPDAGHSNAIAGFDHAKALSLNVGALAPTISALTPEPRILARAMSSRVAGAVELVFEHHGAAAYVDASGLPFSDVIRLANIDMLRVFHRAGFDLSGYSGKMMAQALRRQDPRYYHFLRNEIGLQGPILHHVDLDRALGDPPLWAQPILCAEIDGALRERNPHFLARIKRLGMTPQTSGTLRFFALALKSGLDLDQPNYRRALKNLPKALKLLTLTSSRHGQMKLTAMEPDLSSLISRSKTGIFFGMRL